MVLQDVMISGGRTIASEDIWSFVASGGPDERQPQASIGDELCGLNVAINVTLDVNHHLGVQLEESKSMGRKSTSAESTASMEAEDVEELLTDMLSFKGCEELLRGTRLSTIMAGRCALFRHSKGSALTFSKSERTGGLDAFVSHNWSVPARRKFLVLSYFYNGGRVTLATTGILCTMGVATFAHILPEVDDKSFDGRRVGFLGRLLWFPIGAVLFTCWWDLARLFRYGGPILFLDKVCIHQTDKDLMRRGISKLGAFIKDSKKMLSLYSEEYLRRLWTVYEIATFLSIHKTEDLILLPTTVPILALVTMIVLWFLQIAHFVSMMYTDNTYTRTFIGCFGSLALVMSFRVLFRKKKSMVDAIASFSVQKCVCAQESDRAQVYLNIEALMRKMKSFEGTASQEEVLAAFDQQVREELPVALTKQMGKFILPYDKVLVIGIFNQLPWIVDKMCLLDHPTYWKDDLMVMYHNFLWAVVFAPWSILFVQVVAASHIDDMGFRNMLWSILTCATTIALLAFLTVLTYWAADSALFNIILNVLAVFAIITGRLFLRQ